MYPWIMSNGASGMSEARNIVLTGFMGTGKTTIGQLVANRLGRHFVDLDAVIVQEQGQPIPEIFAEHGEPYFRQLEADVVRRFAEPQSLVVSTGGGALIADVNRQTMLEQAFVVCLTADAEVIEARLTRESDQRPLADHWRELLAQRQPIYALIPHQVDTSHRSPDEIAEEIIRLWQSA